MATSPEISIGLPVYNGENYLEQAIESFLDQSFGNFELIISNNASTDSTHEISLKYSNADKRIRYYQNSVNLGATRNHNRVFELAVGKYFKWAGHDDIYAREYLQKCQKVLNEQQEVVLVYPKTIIIDGCGREIEHYEDGFNLRYLQPSLRLRHILRHPLSKLLNPPLGLTRSECLRKTRLLGNYYAADRVILAELALQGQIAEVPEYLFYRRLHEKNSTSLNPSDDAIAKWCDPSIDRRAPVPRWQRFLANLEGINRTPMGRQDRFLCYLEFWKFYVSPRRFDGAIRDLKQIL
jgi:glycosyltransferase involved in cell wall biosynthesis